MNLYRSKNFFTIIYDFFISLYNILYKNTNNIEGMIDKDNKDWMYYITNPETLLPNYTQSISNYNKTILIECLLKKNEYESNKKYDESLKDKFLTTIQQKLTIRDIFDNLNVGFYNISHKQYISVYNMKDEDTKYSKFFSIFKRKHKNISVLRTSHVPHRFKLKYLYENVCYIQTIKNKYIHLTIKNTFIEVDTADEATQFELISFNDKYTSWFIKVVGQQSAKYLCMETNNINIGLSTNRNTWELFEVVILDTPDIKKEIIIGTYNSTNIILPSEEICRSNIEGNTITSQSTQNTVYSNTIENIVGQKLQDSNSLSIGMSIKSCTTPYCSGDISVKTKEKKSIKKIKSSEIDESQTLEKENNESYVLNTRGYITKSLCNKKYITLVLVENYYFSIKKSFLSLYKIENEMSFNKISVNNDYSWIWKIFGY